MSAETAPTPSEHIIPQGLLENSIKITNEPPTGMLANLHAALYNFDQVRKKSGLTLSQGLLARRWNHHLLMKRVQRDKVNLSVSV